MALDTRTRTSIYQKLVPLLGADDANALMSEFPAADDELVTKSFLRAELADVRTEMAGLRTEIAALETKLTVRMGAGMMALASLMVVLKLFG